MACTDLAEHLVGVIPAATVVAAVALMAVVPTVASTEEVACWWRAAHCKAVRRAPLWQRARVAEGAAAAWRSCRLARERQASSVYLAGSGDRLVEEVRTGAF